jgi:hypothetical protein
MLLLKLFALSFCTILIVNEYSNVIKTIQITKKWLFCFAIIVNAIFVCLNHDF